MAKVYNDGLAMADPAYPAARIVAPRVQAQFAQHLAAAGAIYLILLMLERRIGVT